MVAPCGREPDPGRLVLGLFGLGDDAVVALWLGGTFLAETERYPRWERALGGGTPDH